MATRKNTGSKATANTCELLMLSGTYVIAPETTAAQLQDDIPCLLDGVEGIVSCVMDGMQGSDNQMITDPRQVARLMYAADYLLQMVRAMHVAAVTRA